MFAPPLCLRLFRIPILVVSLLAFSGCKKIPLEEAVQHERGSTVVLKSPENQSQSFSTMPSFVWDEASDAERYEIEIALDSDFKELIDRDEIVIAHYVADAELPRGKLFWRVRTIYENGLFGAFSEGSFTINEIVNIYEIPDGANTSQIELAIAEAAKGTPSIVRFAPDGKYRVAPSNYDLIRLSHVENMIIDGQGAELVFIEPATGLSSLIDCRNILIKDLTVRFDPLPYSIGIVQSVNMETGKFSMVMESSDIPTFDDAIMMKHWTWGVLLDSTIPGKLQDDSPLVVSTRERQVEVSENQAGLAVYTLQLKSPHVAKYFRLGSKYIVFARSKGRGLVRVEGGSDIAFLNIINFGASAGHYTSFESSGLKVLHCKSLIPDGEWFGGNADGLHVRSNDLGPWVEGCKFEGLGDDAVAIYSKGIFLLQQDSPTELRLDTKLFNLKPGHSIRIYNPRDGVVVVDQVTIATIVPQEPGDGGLNQAHFLVTLDQPLKQRLFTGESDPLLNDQIFNRSLVNRNFAVRNNFFKRIRRFGTVVRALSGVIENNVYTEISNIPIVLRNEPDLWRNGLNSEGIHILNNTISDSGFVNGSEGKGQINVVMYKMGHTLANGRDHADIIVSGNTIHNWQEYGISIQNARGVQVTDNLLSSDADGFDNSRKHFGIYINNSEGVLVSGNRFDDSRPLDAEIEVGDNTENVIIETELFLTH
ncbi:right-handed parallel beta-helix repeat-containing protein [Cerasicoccus arenae]|uniref:right-handed parallel beta-helix repeat-containing protein n=1 Tax=Cerasicoccus arenae TaxID=424488 RepID=UPI00167A1F25|nr:right-handed parallel beta-helix repeat-containing protein [Cerasicoccus arenae]MBK1859709.1 right-handed parallel beta-helix repeat-containing protein [Cerasicoccus arenae]